ncbi:MAG: hypothetical protein IKP54_00395 [Bacteroidales bacterium]|nr:hypothetical protein [Bacteroidales bacterium]
MRHDPALRAPVRGPDCLLSCGCHNVTALRSCPSGTRWRLRLLLSNVRLRRYTYVTTPPFGHLLEAVPPFSSSLGKAKVNFVSALAPSSILIEGELFPLQYHYHC